MKRSARMPAGIPVLRPGGRPDDRAEIEGSGLFEDVVVRYFDWEISYSTEEYLRLLDTFSGHIAMQPWQRAPLRGDQAAPRTAVERSTASSLGSGATRRPPSRSNTRLVRGSVTDRRSSCGGGDGH